MIKTSIYHLKHMFLPAKELAKCHHRSKSTKKKGDFVEKCGPGKLEEYILLR
jgi:hypothetical protein